MREYDDYIKLTRQYLKKYNQLKIAVQNIDDEIRAQETLLESESIPSVRYGDDAVSGGRGELTSTEAAAARRIKLEGNIATMRMRRDEMSRTIRAIDRALESLNDEDVELIEGRYIRGLSWMEIAERMNYTEKWAREKGGKVLRDVALMLFGVVVRPAQMKLMFNKRSGR